MTQQIDFKLLFTIVLLLILLRLNFRLTYKFLLHADFTDFSGFFISHLRKSGKSACHFFSGFLVNRPKKYYSYKNAVKGLEAIA